MYKLLLTAAILLVNSCALFSQNQLFPDTTGQFFMPSTQGQFNFSSTSSQFFNFPPSGQFFTPATSGQFLFPQDTGFFIPSTTNQFFFPDTTGQFNFPPSSGQSINQSSTGPFILPGAGGAVSPQGTVNIAARIINPFDGSTFVSLSTVTVTAEVSSISGIPARVDFIIDGITVIGSVLSAPYSIKWENPPAGVHTLMARVVDINGAIFDSPVITVNVTLQR